MWEIKKRGGGLKEGIGGRKGIKGMKEGGRMRRKEGHKGRKKRRE